MFYILSVIFFFKAQTRVVCIMCVCMYLVSRAAGGSRELKSPANCQTRGARAERSAVARTRDRARHQIR